VNFLPLRVANLCACVLIAEHVKNNKNCFIMCVDILLRLVMRIYQDASVIFKDWAKALSLVLPGKNMLKKCKNVLSITLRSEDVNLARVWASRSWCFLRSLNITHYKNCQQKIRFS
jgi:hypothetical protein